MPFIRFLSQTHFKFLFKTWLCLLFLFFIFRTVFFFTNYDPSLNTPLYTNAFILGLRFDNVIICYSLFIPFVLLSISSFIKQKMTLYTLSYYIICIELIFTELVLSANIPYFKQFGSVISKNAFLWQASPKLMTGLIFSDFGYWGYLLLFALLYFVSVYLIRGYFSQLKSDSREFPEHKLIFKIVSFVFVGLYLFYGARGTTSRKTTIHRGFSTISDNQFINALGLNPCFVFYKSLTSKKENVKYIIPKNIDLYFSQVKNYLGATSPDSFSIARKITASGAPTKQNVIIIVMESMAMYKIGYWSGKNLMPEFTSLTKESVLFDRFFSSGIHTFNGVFSTQTGFPSIYIEHGLTKYTNQAFNSLGKTLSENNYTNYFFTTHDPHFDNMEGFLKLNGYKNIVGESDFSLTESISTLGVPDHVLLDKVIERINLDKPQNPFHAFVLTASDHGPWIVPNNIAFKPSSVDEKERATQYADWAIGEFMKKAKKQAWYNNTVFMFLGDHGLYTDKSYQMPLSYNHIPLLVHCPALLKADTISNVGYQPDVFATVMGLLNINYTNESFGINLFKEKHPYVFFSADDKYAVMSENGFCYFNLLDTKEKHLRNGLKFEEKEYYSEKKNMADSMEVQANAIIEAVKYIIHKSYYNQ